MKKATPPTRTWAVPDDQVGARLDVFLTGEMSDLTRSAIKNAIKAGHVSINGKPAKVHQFLKAGDRIEVHATHDTDLASRISHRQNAPSGDPSFTFQVPTIIAETADWMVVDKPAGLLVHPDAKTKHGTLVDFLLAHDPKIARVGEEPSRPGIIHRLDREVSGLMLVAKTPAAYEELKRQFKERKIDKTYLALVYGAPPENEGDLKFRIARSTTKARMAARPSHETGGRAAWTHYRVVKRFHNATLVEADILSGRTHQIRAHFHALGTPILGDPLYVPKKKPRTMTPPRLMLQSVALAFDDPTTGQRRSFTLKPVAAFAEVTKTLS